MKGEAEKALVAALTAHLSNPNPVPPPPLVPKVVAPSNARGDSLPKKPAVRPSTAGFTPPVPTGPSSQVLHSKFLQRLRGGESVSQIAPTANDLARVLNLSPFVRSGSHYGVYIDWNAIHSQPAGRKSDIIATLRQVFSGSIDDYRTSSHCLYCHLRTNPMARRQIGY